MPINSFIARPKPGQLNQLIKALQFHPECEIITASNEELVVIVTETKNKHADLELQEKLNQIESLQLLSMVSGFAN